MLVNNNVTIYYCNEKKCITLITTKCLILCTVSHNNSSYLLTTNSHECKQQVHWELKSSPMKFIFIYIFFYNHFFFVTRQFFSEDDKWDSFGGRIKTATSCMWALFEKGLRDYVDPKEIISCRPEEKS